MRTRRDMRSRAKRPARCRVREPSRAWRTRWLLRRCRSVGRDVRVLGQVWIHGSGTIDLGHRVVLDGSIAPIELYAPAGATIALGDDCYVEGGTSMHAVSSIVVGDRCRLGAFSKVLDSHFHPLRGDRHRRTNGAPVVLEDDVVLEPWAVVLTGTRVGSGTCVGAATVIRRRLPPGLIVSGSPAAARTLPVANRAP
jgi:acetyltransferase-like isoleucine patch superfamily enzyme